MKRKKNSHITTDRKVLALCSLSHLSKPASAVQTVRAQNTKHHPLISKEERKKKPLQILCNNNKNNCASVYACEELIDCPPFAVLCTKKVQRKASFPFPHTGKKKIKDLNVKYEPKESIKNGIRNVFKKKNETKPKRCRVHVPKKAHSQPLRHLNMNVCHFWFTLIQPETGTLSLPGASFQFHILYKAEFKALTTSIIEAIYTKNTAIYRNAQPVISPWFFCVLYILKLFKLPTDFKHCKGGHLVQLLTATDDQWCGSLDIFIWVDTSQKQRGKRKKSQVALLAPFKCRQLNPDLTHNAEAAIAPW